MNQFKSNWKRSAGLGPVSGINKTEFSQRVKPLYFLSEKEVATYAYLMKFQIRFTECPYSHASFRGDVRDSLNKIEEKHPGSKHALVNSFLEILPSIKKDYAEETKKTFTYCKTCGEPASSNTCNSCQLIERLKLKPIKTERNKKLK
jgi:uncharacterized protein (TIGR00269 family)